MISEGLRKHAFWLYGVIVGLAIKGALDRVVSQLITPSAGFSRHNNGIPSVLRLAVFLFTTIQFYLGSVWFFDKFHDAPADGNQVNFALDFLFGLTHFLIFFAWALAIDTHIGPLWLFPTLMVVILLYDMLWCRACKGRGSYNEIRKWTWVNIGVVIFSLMLYAVAYLSMIGLSVAFDLTRLTHHSFRHKIAEGVAFVPILIVSTVDIIGMMTARQIIADWVLERFKPDVPIAP